MVESEAHRRMRKEVEKRLEEKGVDFISSHSPDSEGSGPAFYLDDPRREGKTKSSLQISQPDILVKEDGAVSVIEIEKEAKTPKYLLGDLYAVVHSECYSDELGRVNKIGEVNKVYILIGEKRSEKGYKAGQYENLVEQLREKCEVKFGIFWKDGVVDLVEEC
ncbi:MAG: hypothetical protein V5A88_09180 [Candidatus Thermoplasmatota archaeon]